MTSWADFLKNPKYAFDAVRTDTHLRDFCSLPNGSYDSQDAADITNMIALRLVNTWLYQQPSSDKIVFGCDLYMPFYKSISRAAVLVALGPNSGLSPDTIGLDTLLNEIADFSSGYLARRLPSLQSP